MTYSKSSLFFFIKEWGKLNRKVNKNKKKKKEFSKLRRRKKKKRKRKEWGERGRRGRGLTREQKPSFTPIITGDVTPNWLWNAHWLVFEYIRGSLTFWVRCLKMLRKSMKEAYTKRMNSKSIVQYLPLIWSNRRYRRYQGRYNCKTQWVSRRINSVWIVSKNRWNLVCLHWRKW